MKYELHVAEGPKTPAAAADLPDAFEAETWARAWAAAHADHDTYDLREIEGGRSWDLFRTQAGRWLLTSTTQRPAA